MIEALNGKTGTRDSKPNVRPNATWWPRKAIPSTLAISICSSTRPGTYAGQYVRRRNRAALRRQRLQAIWGAGAPGLAGAKQGVINASKIAAVKGIQVFLMTHFWQELNGYPGGGIHARAKLLGAHNPSDPNPFVDPATWQARVKRTQENAAKTLAAEECQAASK
jgi:hypothetical protein